MRFLFFIPIIFAISALSSCSVNQHVIDKVNMDMKIEKIEYKIEKLEIKNENPEDKKEQLQELKEDHEDYVRYKRSFKRTARKSKSPYSMSSRGDKKKFYKEQLKELRQEYRELKKKEDELIEKYVVLESNVFEADTAYSVYESVVEVEVANMMSIDFAPVLVSSWDDFYEKNPFFKNSEELQTYLFDKYHSVKEYNLDRVMEFYNMGMISEKQFSSYTARVNNGEVFEVSLKEPGYYYHNTDENTAAWIPNVENMDIIDKAKDDSTSSTGTIAYSVPEEMTVGEKYKITVRISKKKGTEIKKTLVLGEREIPISDENISSKITIENIRVERTMTVKLLSEDGAFEISPTSTDKQVLEDESYTEWSWIVKPLESGTNYLKMIITVKVEAGDETSYKDIVVFDKNIKVKSNVSLGVKSWISEYWQWLMTTIIIPLVVFFYKKRNKEKEDKENKEKE